MKVWMKTKNNIATNLVIPHSSNIAQAMYGFFRKYL